MSSGVFGSIRPATFDTAKDVDIYYMYRPTRGEKDENFKGFKTLDAESCLVPAITDEEKDIKGLYTLRLPLGEFNKKGFYTIYIKPKEYETKIVDVSTLVAFPEVKGVVINISDLGMNASDLVGYRFDFKDGTSRLIKSCNRCNPQVMSNNYGSAYTTRYNLTDGSSDLVFCTVSPSSAPTFKPNAAPYIGKANEVVNIVNTKFTPKMIEIETTDHDIETLSYMLEGDQVTDRDKAIITTYNSNKEIYHQADYYILKNNLGEARYNVKVRRTDIDSGQEYGKIVTD